MKFFGISFTLNQLRILKNYSSSDNFPDLFSILINKMSHNVCCFPSDKIDTFFKTGDVKLLESNENEIIVELREKGCKVSKDLYFPCSDECLMLLAQASITGIDITGMNNEYLNSDMLKFFIEYKKQHKLFDLSFLYNLSLDEIGECYFNLCLGSPSKLGLLHSNIESEINECISVLQNSLEKSVSKH